jgi:hypothetical protein
MPFTSVLAIEGESTGHVNHPAARSGQAGDDLVSLGQAGWR